VALTTGTWLITGSATLKSSDIKALADCSMTIKGDKDSIYPIVFKPMGADEIESFTAAILVAVESQKPASATASCTGEKPNPTILNLTISALEVEVPQP